MNEYLFWEDGFYLFYFSEINSYGEEEQGEDVEAGDEECLYDAIAKGEADGVFLLVIGG